ncbi:MAG: glycoside hydrolase family 57 protein [Bacteroidales bacterium]|nr:glycoside hydrolase family 57 protein [Bacteroidales bacterium]
MKTICFYFQIHQPFRLKRYRFFDIGGDHYYYDDFNNEAIITRIAERSYRPALQTLSEMIENSGKKFKAAFSISGTALEQMEIHAPEVIESLKSLAKTGCIEFLAETYAHSLSSLYDDAEFERQVKLHSAKIQNLFGQTPVVFRNTELIYSDEIGEKIQKMGFKGVMIEGAKHILGWKSPNFVYNCASSPKLKILMRNYRFSDDISFRFSNQGWSGFPLTAEKYIDWIASTPENETNINLFMNFDTFGEFQTRESGIFNFLKALPRCAEERKINFRTPSEIFQSTKAVDSIHVMHNISWADEERDTSAWLGNRLQKDAADKLYSISERVRMSKDRRLMQDWNYLQSSDHFYYMSTKHSSDGAVHSHFSPYDTPFDAFTNYMNVLGDFIARVNAQFPDTIENEELNALLTTIHNQDHKIMDLEEELKKLKATKRKESKATKA